MVTGFLPETTHKYYSLILPIITMPSLTIFTPTYNRAYCLHRCYESLCRQSCRDFEWLVIDDGSTDDTKSLVEKWISEKKIPIRYFYKINGGMHTAHNTAYRIIKTELNTCIDSDDYMPDDAVEKILTSWEKRGNEEVSGLVGLDATYDNKVIGSTFPKNKKRMTLTDFYHQGGYGDKKLVFRTEVMQSLPEYPEFPGEKYVGLGYKYMLADLKMPLLLLNEVLVHVEYQMDGSSSTMWQQYGRHPQGFAFLRRETIKHHPYVKERIRAAVHHISSCLYIRRNPLVDSPNKIMTLAVFPLGILVHMLILYKSRH